MLNENTKNLDSEQYDKYIKQYLKKGLMQEEYVIDAVKEIIRGYMADDGFSDRKVTDVPTDSYAVTNRRYVNLNGISSARPLGSVVGQFYLDTTVGKPVWWDGTKFIDATGTVA